jgi:hypothetical protein
MQIPVKVAQFSKPINTLAVTTGHGTITVGHDAVIIGHDRRNTQLLTLQTRHRPAKGNWALAMALYIFSGLFTLGNKPMQLLAVSAVG